MFALLICSVKVLQTLNHFRSKHLRSMALLCLLHPEHRFYYSLPVCPSRKLKTLKHEYSTYTFYACSVNRRELQELTGKRDHSSFSISNFAVLSRFHFQVFVSTHHCHSFVPANSQTPLERQRDSQVAMKVFYERVTFPVSTIVLFLVIQFLWQSHLHSIYLSFALNNILYLFPLLVTRLSLPSIIHSPQQPHLHNVSLTSSFKFYLTSATFLTFSVFSQ